MKKNEIVKINGVVKTWNEKMQEYEYAQTDTFTYSYNDTYTCVADMRVAFEKTVKPKNGYVLDTNIYHIDSETKEVYAMSN